MKQPCDDFEIFPQTQNKNLGGLKGPLRNQSNFSVTEMGLLVKAVRFFKLNNSSRCRLFWFANS